MLVNVKKKYTAKWHNYAKSSITLISEANIIKLFWPNSTPIGIISGKITRNYTVRDTTYDEKSFITLVSEANIIKLFDLILPLLA